MEELKKLEEEREQESFQEKQVLGLKGQKEITGPKEIKEQKRKTGADYTDYRQKSIKDADKKKGTHQSLGIASDEMCTFLIINISSLQLIPVNVIAYRSQYGSTNPTGIIGVSIAVTLFSTLVAVVFCKVMQRRRVKK